MPDRWLTIAEAAERVGRDPRTIKRWRANDEITVLADRVRESDLLDADKRIRARKGGRPRKTVSTLSS